MARNPASGFAVQFPALIRNKFFSCLAINGWISQIFVNPEEEILLAFGILNGAALHHFFIMLRFVKKCRRFGERPSLDFKIYIDDRFIKNRGVNADAGSVTNEKIGVGQSVGQALDVIKAHIPIYSSRARKTHARHRVAQPRTFFQLLVFNKIIWLKTSKKLGIGY